MTEKTMGEIIKSSFRKMLRTKDEMPSALFILGLGSWLSGLVKIDFSQQILIETVWVCSFICAMAAIVTWVSNEAKERYINGPNRKCYDDLIDQARRALASDNPDQAYELADQAREGDFVEYPADALLIQLEAAIDMKQPDMSLWCAEDLLTMAIQKGDPPCIAKAIEFARAIGVYQARQGLAKLG